MLYSNNFKKINNSGGYSSNNQDEVKRMQQAREEAQKQQQKTHLQIQIDNRRKEIDRLDLDLKLKQNKLREVKTKIDDHKRGLFVLETKVKQEEGSLGYLGDQTKTKKAQETLIESQLISLQTKKDALNADILKIKKEILEREAILATKVNEGNKIDQEIKSLEIQDKQADSTVDQSDRLAGLKKKEIEKEKQEIMFKKRVVEQLERDMTIFDQEVSHLERDKQDKEREKKNLEIERDRI